MHTVSIQNIPSASVFLFQYQRLVNNLIGAIGVIKCGEIYYPNINFDQSGNVYLEMSANKLTGVDIKTINTHTVKDKLQELMGKLEDPNTRETFIQVTDDILKEVDKFFDEQQEKEYKEGKRYPKNIRFYKTKEEVS